MRDGAAQVASRWHGALVHSRRVRRLAERIDPLLPRSARVLDVGSGDGRLGAALLARRPDLEIQGLDVLARPQAAIPTELYAGGSLPFPDAAFDVAMLVDVLHHEEDAADLLRDAARVASRYVVVKDHLRSGFGAETTLRFMDWVGNRPHGVALPYRYLDAGEWKQLLHDVGLEVDVRETSLALYPRPFRWIFDRSLHFVARLRSARLVCGAEAQKRSP